MALTFSGVWIIAIWSKGSPKPMEEGSLGKRRASASEEEATGEHVSSESPQPMEQEATSSASASEQEATGEHVSLPWEDFFMDLAFGASMRSKDEKSRVGCVFVSSDTLQVLSLGYNGFTKRISHSKAKKLGKPKYIVHAEANAINLKGHAFLEGAYAFVTVFPCFNCAKKLIQACIRRVYFLSVRGNNNTKESWKLLERAGVELIPYPREKADGTLTKFGEVLIHRITKVYNRIQEDTEKYSENEDFKALKEKSDEVELLEFLDRDSPWKAEDEESRERVEFFDLWEHWFMFLAMIAATKSTVPGRPEGCVLVDSKEFKICGMSYRGYPRGIEKDDQELKGIKNNIEVSAITNALSLKFKEGEKYHCFATHFPSNEEAKDLAQASVKKLCIICPAYEPSEPIDKDALTIFNEAGIEVKVIDLKTQWKDVNKKIEETLKFLYKKEKETKTNFTWPTPETFRGLEAGKEAVLTLAKPLILGGKRGIKPSRY